VVLDLTDEQDLLRETTIRFIEERCPMPEVRRRADAPDGQNASHSRELGGLGWFGLFVPEEHGGGSVSGSPLRDAVIVAEARGRFVQPGPFTATNVVAFALAEDGSAAQQAAYLPALASGELIGTWAISDGSGLPQPGAVTVGVRAGGFILDGRAGLVPEVLDAGLLLLTAAHRDDPAAITQFVVPTDTPGVAVSACRGLDLTQRFATIRFDDVVLSQDNVVGEVGAAARLVERQCDLGTVLTIADSVGAMRRLMEITVEYVRERIAFGRPIGSFQALKHMLADASLRAELSAAVFESATEAAADGRPTASEIVSIAKAYAGDAGVDVAQTCFQAHGGIGFTWEHDLHFYLRRLQTNRVLYGDPPWHHERICRIHELGVRTGGAR
jgi:alkylation response protein AidB-like acyl-CoA dehydrogenase